MNAVIRNASLALAAASLLSLAACKSTDTDDSMNATPAPESSAPMSTMPPSSSTAMPPASSTTPPPQTP